MPLKLLANFVPSETIVAAAWGVLIANVAEPSIVSAPEPSSVTVQAATSLTVILAVLFAAGLAVAVVGWPERHEKERSHIRRA